MTEHGEPTIVALGDSALWTTGTRYEDKTPNLVHKRLRGGEPIQPTHFRARGGAVIGLSRRYKDSPGARGSRSDWRKSPDYYHFVEDDADWYSFYDPGDSDDVDRIKWSIGRDIGSPYPTIVQQIEQFPRRTAGEDRENDRWALDTPDPGVSLGGEGSVSEDDHPPYAEDVDLLLLNGSTNDIDLEWINDYRPKSRSDIHAATRRHCYRDHVDLLGEARDRFPNAIIALVGYFPFLSDWTDKSRARDFLKRQIGWAKGTVVPIERIVDHALSFARAHVHYMRKAVAERARAEARNGHPGVFFVARGFGTVHALYAPRTWTWGEFDDDTHEWRQHACQHTDPSDGEVPADDLDAACVSAGIGHPNRTGSRQTADAIVDRYEEYTRLSTHETIEELETGGGGSNDGHSVRAELERHGIDGEGLRYGLSHRYVDSIEVRLTRGDELNDDLGGIGRNPYLLDKAHIYLEIEPGRSGYGERFKLDWEDNNGASAKDTPQFDNNSGRHTHVYVDPMHERDMDGFAGVTESGFARETPSATDWDSDPLRLGDVREMHLVVRNSSRWALEEVRVTINGVIEHTKDVDQVTNADEVRIDNLLANGY